MNQREKARALLPEHATQLEDGSWNLNSTPGFYPRTEDEAVDVIEACLLLDVPITDTIKGSTWLKLIKRVVALEELLEARHT